MVKLYLKRIHAGLLTIEEVPSRWRAKVQAELDKEAANTENPSNEPA